MQKDANTPHINVDYFEDLTGKIENGETSDIDDVGIRIRELREKKGFSIEELANMTGFEKERLEDIENGVIKPQLGTVMRLSRALDSAFFTFSIRSWLSTLLNYKKK